jgi:Dyp-type peroxidase family
MPIQATDTSGSLTAEIQANILAALNFPHARFVLVSLGTPVQARTWLGSLQLTNGGHWGGTPKPDPGMTVALTHAGLEALGVREEVRLEFPEAFRAGMPQRRADLQDDPDQAWEPHFTTGNIHALVSIYATTEAVADQRANDVISQPGVTALHTEKGREVATSNGWKREHFGFRDGISQPVSADVTTGTWTSEVPIKEFLLFDSTWNGGNGSADGRDLARLGTFLVYRKLRQDVVAFRRLVKGWSIDADFAAAKLVGRWVNGTPVSDVPIDPEDITKPDDSDPNFATAPGNGVRCPIGAHISRANPRTRMPGNAPQRRLLRRGMPYGATPLAVGTPFSDPIPVDDGYERGLVFIALNADIERQFEFVQRKWMNGSFLGVDGVDPIASSRPADEMGKFTAPPHRPVKLKPVVELKGGEYFFIPRMDAREKLANGDFS